MYNVLDVCRYIIKYSNSKNQRENATGSTIIAHDGEVFHISRIKQIEDIDSLIEIAYNKVKQERFVSFKHLQKCECFFIAKKCNKN